MSRNKTDAELANAAIAFWNKAIQNEDWTIDEDHNKIFENLPNLIIKVYTEAFVTGRQGGYNDGYSHGFEDGCDHEQK